MAVPWPFYGDRDGYLVDPFGHGWTVATRVEDVAPEELMRRMEELQTQIWCIDKKSS